MQHFSIFSSGNFKSGITFLILANQNYEMNACQSKKERKEVFILAEATQRFRVERLQPESPSLKAHLTEATISPSQYMYPATAINDTFYDVNTSLFDTSLGISDTPLELQDYAPEDAITRATIKMTPDPAPQLVALTESQESVDLLEGYLPPIFDKNLSTKSSMNHDIVHNQTFPAQSDIKSSYINVNDTPIVFTDPGSIEERELSRSSDIPLLTDPTSMITDSFAATRGDYPDSQLPSDDSCVELIWKVYYTQILYLIKHFYVYFITILLSICSVISNF